MVGALLDVLVNKPKDQCYRWRPDRFNTLRLAAERPSPRMI